ncbi:hypothetical protein [Paraburkholderia sp. MM5477-R1]|uniref:hypothetical protein n=1 Tax=Paraburkholderia sp. MM5477-R1 TaxID=2991062 RepID=UPI003D1A382C
MGPIRGENRTTPQRLPAQHNVKNANQSNKKEREDAAATNVQNADVQKPDVTKVGEVKPQATKAAANESRKNENACYRCEGMRAVQDWYRRNPHGIHSRIRRAPIFFMR